MQDSDDVDVTIQNILEYSRDIEATKRRIETLNESVREEIEECPEFTEVQESAEKLKAAKERLRLALQSNARYNNMLEKLGELKDTKKDQEEILSDHIVAYYAMTRERQIQVADDGDAQDLVLKGRLGAHRKYQTNLFAGGSNE